MILRRLFRVVFTTSLARGVASRDKKWLTIAGGVLLFRVIERMSARAARRPPKEKGA